MNLSLVSATILREALKMGDTHADMNPNRMVRQLGKVPAEFAKRDLMRFVEENNVEMINFRFVDGEGKLKTLNFVITSKSQLARLLSSGERVDGSSLFPYIDTAQSDLYVIPRYDTAYLNPFSSIPTLDILCSYYTEDGTRLDSAPENVVRKAHEVFKDKTGMTLEAMGELEYYVLYGKENLYTLQVHKSYHESSPFTKWEQLRCEAMKIIASVGGKIKYGHSEVGNIYGDSRDMEQHEIEFLPMPVEKACDQITIAKWILRMIGYKYGVTITFTPKLSVGHAGSGLHIHTRLVKDGKDVMVEKNTLSGTAKKVVAGYLSLASSLTAFGNTVPTSYLRLVPHQEAPTNICWGDRNRSVLVRVPLGWLDVKNMARDANPQDKDDTLISRGAQTIEFRGPDGSANIYLLLAGLTVAARHGMDMKNALGLTQKRYVDVNIFSSEYKKIQKSLPKLPTSCWESAENLLKDREIYQEYNVFTSATIDGVVKKLKSYEDKNLSKRLHGKEDEINKLIETHLHCS